MKSRFFLKLVVSTVGFTTVGALDRSSTQRWPVRGVRMSGSTEIYKSVLKRY